MFKTILQTIRPRSKPALPKLTMYHNPRLPLSNHLLKKLNYYENLNKFVIEVKPNQLPSYSSYKFMHSSLNTHPSNCNSFEAIFPQLFHHDSTFNDLTAKRDQKLKLFVNDYELVNEDRYNHMVKQTNVGNPVIIDWSHDLIAINDESLDRILAHYLTCGIQNSKSVHDEGFLRSANDDGFLRNKYGHHIIHPHIAEYADLF